MKNRSRLIRKITNLLGITFISLGMIPVPVLSQIGSVYAQVEDGAAAIDLPAFVSYTELLGSASVALDTVEIDLPKFASYAGLLESTSTEDPPADETPTDDTTADEPAVKKPAAKKAPVKKPTVKKPAGKTTVKKKPATKANPVEEKKE